MSRTSNTIKNIRYAILGQIGGIFVSFIARMVFLRYLSNDFLGVNTLFSNIMTVLSFAELGFGTAITYSLYRPLSSKNIDDIKGLMCLFKKVYTIIGSVILVAGIVMLPFLSLLTRETPNIGNLQFIFMLFVINSAISYYFSYKRTLIIADQKRYIATAYRYIFFILLNLFQMIILITTKNYYCFLILQIIFTLLENIFISIKANKMYPFLSNGYKCSVSKETKKNIYKNTRAMMLHKIGSIVINAEDNIIISAFIGIGTVGFYSNYQLIKNGLETMLGQIYSSISASLGNLCASESKEKQIEIFNKLNFLTFCLFCFASTGFIVLSEPFVTAWIGDGYILPINTVLLIIAIFYLTGMRKSVLTFREALGLFYKDRYKPVIEAAVNLVSSILLANIWGLNGVLLGTIISTIVVAVEWEVYILFHYGFKKKVKQYYKKYLFFLIIELLTIAISCMFAFFFKNIILPLRILISILVCVTLPMVIIHTFFRNTKEYKFFVELARSSLIKYITRVQRKIHKK